MVCDNLSVETPTALPAPPLTNPQLATVEEVSDITLAIDRNSLHLSQARWRRADEFAVRRSRQGDRAQVLFRVRNQTLYPDFRASFSVYRVRATLVWGAVAVVFRPLCDDHAGRARTSSVPGGPSPIDEDALLSSGGPTKCM